MSTYRAIDEFRANLDGGVNPVLVKRGTFFTYDGNIIEVMGSDGVVKKGSVPMLKSQLGEWFVAVTAKATEVTEPQAAPQPLPPANSPEQIARAQAVVDSSAIGGNNLEAMVNRYDNMPNLRNREAPKIIDDDATIVAQVTKTAGESKTVNTSGVQIENSEVGRRPVVSHEQRQVKETHYNPTVEPSEPKKRKLVVVQDSEGVVVKKTSEKAIFKTEVRMGKNVELDAAPKTISREGDVVKTASYPQAESVDIGSSTLTQTVVKTAEEKKIAGERAAAAKALRMKQIAEDPEGVVVAKVRTDEDFKSTADGFTAKLKVGKDSSEGIIIGDEAVVSDGGINRGFGEEAVVSAGGNVSISDSEDVAISDILNEMN